MKEKQNLQQNLQTLEEKNYQITTDINQYLKKEDKMMVVNKDLAQTIQQKVLNGDLNNYTWMYYDDFKHFGQKTKFDNIDQYLEDAELLLIIGPNLKE